MKKILSVLLIFVFCFALCVPMLASDKDGLTVTNEKSSDQQEKVYAKRGEKVAVNIKVNNNKGFVSLVCGLSYDKENFTCSEGVTSVPDELMVLSNLKDRRQRISWETEKLANYTKNGTIATLHFTIGEDTPYGEYPIKVSGVQGFKVPCDSVDVDVSISTIVVTEEAKTAITGATIGLESDISVNYFATLADDHKNAKMRFTMNDRETVVEGTPTGVADQYVFEFRDVSPQCMGDNIKAELVLGDTVLAEKSKYSVLEYCRSQLSKSAAQLGISQEKYQALKTLIADILEYGAKAQMYKNYKTDALVNAGITGKTEFSPIAGTDKKVTESILDGAKFVAAGVYFDSVNSVFVRFTVPSTTGSFTVNVKHGENTSSYSLDDCKLTNPETLEYVLVLDGVGAMEFDSVYTIELKKTENGAASVLQTLTYSVRSYVYSMQNKTDSNGALSTMAELARATYNYGASAKAYATK